jgi:Gpi18-like mannosyltransferase
MFNPCQKSTGITYTTTVVWLAVAFLCSPAVLAVSRPWGHWSISLAITGSALCVTWAWVNGTKNSHLSIPSIAAQGEKVFFKKEAH